MTLKTYLCHVLIWKWRVYSGIQGWKAPGERSEWGFDALCRNAMHMFIRAIHLFFESWQFFGDIAKYQWNICIGSYHCFSNWNLFSCRYIYVNIHQQLIVNFTTYFMIKMFNFIHVFYLFLWRLTFHAPCISLLYNLFTPLLQK